MFIVAGRPTADRAIFYGRPPFTIRRMTSTGREIGTLTSGNSVQSASWLQSWIEPRLIDAGVVTS